MKQTWSQFRGARHEDVAAPMQEGRLKELCRQVFSDPLGEELLDLLMEAYVFRTFDWGVSERALRDFEGFRKCVLTLRTLARSQHVGSPTSNGPKRRRTTSARSKSDAGSDKG